jgi:tetratricopeptide (TPR) repeat protein
VLLPELALRISRENGVVSASLVQADGSVLASSSIKLELSADDPGISEDYGPTLTRTVLPGRLGEVLGSAGPVRLRVVADGAPDLAGLRWERLLRSRTSGEAPIPMAVSPDTPLSRLLFPDSNDRQRPPETAWPLRAVVAIASPAGLDRFGLPPLDPDLEWAELVRAVEPLRGLVDLMPVKPPVTLDRVAQALESNPHILHFLGHGFFDPDTGRAALYLEKEPVPGQPGRGEARPVPQEEWTARWGGLAHRPHLVVLAACESAGRVNRGALVGVAPTLIRAGSSAVVAMADRVGIDVAREFIFHFYRRLASHGFIDIAANEARSYLLDRGGWSWSIPTTFVERGAERIFAQPPEALEADPAAPGETLILIPEFKGSEEAFFEFELRERLQAEVDKASLGAVRVVWLKNTALGPGSEDEVRRLAARYGAALVVWGWYDRSGLRACFTVTESLFAYRDPAVFQETVSVRNDLGPDQDFAIVVNQNLPRQVDYFVFFTLAQLHYWAGQYEQALRAFDQAAQAAETDSAGGGPESLEFAYFYRANLNAVHRQDRPAAIRDYRKALDLAPGFAMAAYNLGQALRILGEWKRAEKDESGAREAYEQALEAYGRAVEADPAFAQAYSDRGLTHWELQENDLAIVDVRKAIELEPEAETYNRLGAALFDQGRERWPDALSAFDAALARSPAVGRFLFNRGRVRAAMGDVQGAAADFEEYLQQSPDAQNRGRVEAWLRTDGHAGLAVREER